MAKEADFLKILDEYQNVIHSVCRMYTDNRDDHEDLFQEVLSQLWIGFQRFKHDSKISTWVYRVALYTAITYIKKVMRARSVLDELEKEESHSEQSVEYETILFDAVKRLNELDRALIVLYLDEKSYEEMAEIMGLSMSNVGVKLNRIKKKLKNIMQPEYGT